MADEGKECKTSDKPEVDEDEELAALLESAVGDFDKPNDSEKKEPSAKPTPPDSLWAQDFVGNEPRINPQFASLFSPDGAFGIEQLSQELARLAEASAQTAGLETSPDADFSAMIAETFRSMAENAENIQGEINDEAVFSMLQGMNNIPEGETGDMMQFIRNIMQGLLSKEILQPAISSLVEKYPAWLDENRTKLSAEDLARYEKQLSVMKTIDAEMDLEAADDSEDVKKARFDKVLELLQVMQSCGPPPSDLVSASGAYFDEDTMNMLGNSAPAGQCVLQ